MSHPEQASVPTIVILNGGLLPIPTFDKVVMLSRAGAEGGVDLSKISCGPPGGSLAIAGASDGEIPLLALIESVAILLLVRLWTLG
jgi:hypothetical protein